MDNKNIRSLNMTNFSELLLSLTELTEQPKIYWNNPIGGIGEWHYGTPDDYLRIYLELGVVSGNNGALREILIRLVNIEKHIERGGEHTESYDYGIRAISITEPDFPSNFWTSFNDLIGSEKRVKAGESWGNQPIVGCIQPLFQEVPFWEELMKKIYPNEYG